MNNTPLKISDLSHYYISGGNKLWSLNSFDLTLKSGELIGLLGPSGCGKTTLLRLIAGFEKPYSGYVSIDNQIVSSLNVHIPPERRGVGMVFQDYALFPHLSCWRNVCFGIRQGDNISRAEWLIDLLGLSGFKDRYPHELSGGQKQRLALARALAPGNSLVLLDEPFSNLDVEVRFRLRSELSSVLKSCSASAILVTHDPQEALAICDRVAVMQNGKLHQCSTPVDLVSKPATTFVGKFVLQRNSVTVANFGDKINSPFGFLKSNSDVPIGNDLTLMFDDYSLNIESDINGKGIIDGREFLGSSWLNRVQIDGYIIRVATPFEQSFPLGEKVTLKYANNKTGIIFPGSLSIDLINIISN